MKLSVLTFLLSSATCLAANLVCAQTPLPFPQGKISVVVRGEDLKPIPDATTGVSFVINTYNNPLIERTMATSSSDGTVSAEGKCDGNVDFSVQKDGFYKSVGHYHFMGHSEGKWLPWNPALDVILKRIVQPVPLYAKKIDIELPCDSYPVGYDLIAGDWVEPYGRGANSDLNLRADRRISSRADYDVSLQLTFSNPDDGIIPIPMSGNNNSGSVLLLPQLAPQTGYSPQYQWHIGVRDRIKELAAGRNVKVATNNQAGTAPENQGYIFRIRTIVDSRGKIVQAMYGKIQRDVSVFPGVQGTAHAAVGFTYYLNPSGQPNLEFDPTRNLFGTLPINQEVREP